MELHLKRIRENKGIGQKEMAQLVSDLIGKEVKVRTYGSWERQEVDMDLEQAYYCAVALGCTLNDLVGMRSGELDGSESKLVGDYRDTHDYFKPEISAYAEGMAERHPKNEARGDSRRAACEGA